MTTAISYMWEVIEDAYHRRIRYVKYPEGQIVGDVSGENYNSSAEWDASTRLTKDRHIGYYTTQELAKKAVESFIKSKRGK